MPAAVVGDLGGDEEEVVEPEGADGGELLLELVACLGERFTLVALEEGLVTAAFEVGARAEAGGYAGDGRQEAFGEEFEGGSLGDPVGVEHRLGEGETVLDHVRGHHGATLVLGALRVGLVDGDAEACAGERVEQALVVGSRVADLGRGDGGQAHVLGETAQHPRAAIVPGQAVVEELHVEPVGEGALELADAPVELVDLPTGEEACRQAVAGAREAHEVVRVREQDGPG